MAYELVHKPTFTTQLLALPSAEIPRVLEKISVLETSPQPDAKNKKRLKGCKGAIYRIRAGTYRILYTFGEGWVALLGVDHRKDVYDDGNLVFEAPAFDVAQLPGNEGLFEPQEQTWAWEQPLAAAKPAQTTAEDLPT